MGSPTLDPTAGVRARRIRVHPEDPERVSDPMDARYGEFTPNAPTSTEFPAADRRPDRPQLRRERHVNLTPGRRKVR